MVKMSSSLLSLCTLVAMLGHLALGYEAGVIEQAGRNVYLSEPDTTLFVNNLKFIPGSSSKVGKKTIFEYVVAADYADTLIAVDCITQDTKEKLVITRVDGPRSRSVLESSSFNETDFLWF